MREFEDLEEGNQEELSVKHSIFPPKVYPIARMEFFINGLKIFGLAIVAFLIMGVLAYFCGGIDIPTGKATPLGYVYYAICFIPILYLSIMNQAKRIYDLEWVKTTKGSVWLTIGLNIAGAIPFVGSLIEIIVGICLLFAPGKKA